MLLLYIFSRDRISLYWLGRSFFGHMFRKICACARTSAKVHSSSWDSLISEHVRCGNFEQGLSLYKKVQDICPLQVSERTFVVLLKACTQLKDVSMAKKIHAKVFMEGLLQENIFIGSALVNTYVKCGALSEAHEVFDLLSRRDVVAWTTLIAGYSQHEQSQEALRCFGQMQLEGVAANARTFACILKACGSVGDLDKGKEIHVEIADNGYSGENVFLSSALIDMYAKCGSLGKARAVFDEISAGDVACWNAMIMGYVYHDQGEEALTCYTQMQMAGFCPDSVTFACILKACCSIGALRKGIDLHAEITRKGLLRDNFVLSNALMDMYAKCGDLQKVDEMFHQIDNPDVVTWTALIASYAEHEQNEKALACFERMRATGVAPNAATFACSLKACGNMGAIEKGKELHKEISRLKLLKDNLALANAVVDMYCKCGMPANAQIVFVKFPTHSVVLWTTLITGYALIGDIGSTLQVFHRMIYEGGKPSIITFVSVFKACSHAGLINKSHILFKAMVEDHVLVPTIEHYACMVDLFARSGQLDIALELALRIPFHPSITMWRSILGSCRKCGDVKLGRRTFQAAMELTIRDLWPDYICMLSIFSKAGMYVDADKVNKIRKKEASSP